MESIHTREHGENSLGPSWNFIHTIQLLQCQKCTLLEGKGSRLGYTSENPESYNDGKHGKLSLLMQ